MAEKLTILSEPLQDNGPKAVAGSLLRGLPKIKADFNINPGDLSEVGEAVVVLSGIEALKSAIDWKSRGIIKKLLAGPNTAGVPFQISSIPLSQQIDIYLHPCQWTINWWKSIDPDFNIPLYIWPAGVDTGYWQPPASELRTNNVLFYKKKCPEDLFQSCIRAVQNKGLNVSIIEYGAYNHDDYKIKLAQSDFAVFFSESESQGIALFECWSCNVPALVWDRGYFEWLGYRDKASAAPYLSGLTGSRFRGEEELEISLTHMLDNLKIFQPRLWVLNNGSDEVSTSNLINIINSI